MISAASVTTVKNNGSQADTLIRSLDATFYKFQRHNVPFTITNTSNGYGTFTWNVLNLVTFAIDEVSNSRSPSFTLPEGHYLIYGEVQGLNPDKVARVFWHNRLRVLGTKDTWDFQVNLDDGNNFIDCTGWGSNIKVRANQTDATVGKIRFSNYTGTKVQFIVDEPMLINSFIGGHAIQFINCSGNFIVDAVGDTDEYYITCDGMGVSTSHAVCLNTTADIRCEFTELYGLDIQVDETGASGIRVLADVSATYNRTLAPLDGLKIAHCKIIAGHEGIYLNVSTETGAGDVNKPRKNINTDIWDITITSSKRDPFQWGNQINGRAHNITILEAATLGEPSHDSYIVFNSGNENCKLFNVTGANGLHGISLNLGETGTLPMIWNVILKLNTLPSQSTWNFIQTGDGATTDMFLMNITNIAETGDEIVYRFDASGSNTRDIDRFILTNIASLKGTSANFFTADGSPSQVNWNRTSGNQSFIPANHADAMVDVNGFINDIDSPLIDGGFPPTDFINAIDWFGDYDGGDLSFVYDINGYVMGIDSEYPTGADSGTELKLAALV